MTGIQQIVTTAAQNNGVPAGLALAVATAESSMNPNAVSSAGAQGLFQLEPATAAQLGVTDPFDPVQSANGGTAYLAQLYAEYGNWEDALTAYNWGPGNVSKYGADAAPASTQSYVANVLSNAGLTGEISNPAAAPEYSTVVDTMTATGEPEDLVDDGTAATSDNSWIWWTAAIAGGGLAAWLIIR